MAGNEWRWRKCLNCDKVSAGGKYEWVSGGSWGTNPRRRCPGCGIVAEGSMFPIVRDTVAAAQAADRIPCATCGSMPTGVFHDGSPKYSCGPHTPIYPTRAGV